MKIRNGFVSNSSSSSFIVVGYEISEEEHEILGQKLGEDYVERFKTKTNVNFHAFETGDIEYFFGSVVAFGEDYLETDAFDIEHIKHNIKDELDADSLLEDLFHKKRVKIYTGTAMC